MTDTATERLSVVVEREFPFPSEKVWRALTQPHLIEEWLMKNDFKPVVDHSFNLRADWGTVDCRVTVVEPNKKLAYTWAAHGLESVVTWTLTPTSTGTHLRMELPGRSAAGLPRRRGRMAAVLRKAGASVGADGLKSAGPIHSFRFRRATVRSPIKYEHMGSAGPPLAVHCLYAGRHRQFHRSGTRRTTALDCLLAAAPTLLAPVQRSLHVRVALCRQVAQ